MDTKPTGSGQLGEGAGVVLGMVALMWAVEVIDSIDSHRLDHDGIVPRNVGHLYGIATAPFLHASFGHLLANTVPFVILGLAIAFRGALRVIAVTLVVIAVSGIGTWLTAPAHSVTVGASGVVFGYATYLIARGFFNHRAGEIAIGIGVGVLFGGALLASLIPHSGISWQAHLFGAFGGILAARLFAVPRGDPASRSPAVAR